MEGCPGRLNLSFKEQPETYCLSAGSPKTLRPCVCECTHVPVHVMCVCTPAPTGEAAGGCRHQEGRISLETSVLPQGGVRGGQRWRGVGGTETSESREEGPWSPASRLRDSLAIHWVLDPSPAWRHTAGVSESNGHNLSFFTGQFPSA